MARRRTMYQTIPASELSIGERLRGSADLGMGMMFAFDRFSGETLLMMPIPRPGVIAYSGSWVPRPTTDVDITHLMEWLQNNHFTKVSADKVNRAVDAEAHRNEFSAAKDRLMRLPKWDGVVRLDHFWTEVCGAFEAEEGMSEDEIYRRTRYLAATARCTFIAIIARILDPGCKVDTVPVLEGKQGALKSTLLRKMALDDQWFSDQMPHNLSDKDAKQHIAGKLIVELAEMSQMRASRIETVKSFITIQTDQYRPSYGRRQIRQPRQCVFIGTTNNDDYLVDITGNRRFWPIACGSIDIAKACQWMPQLYAEALEAYHGGEKWYLSSDVDIIAESEQMERIADDPWTDGVREAVVKAEREARAQSEVSFWVTTEMGMECVLPQREKWDRSAQMRTAQVLVKLGGKRGKLPYLKGFPRRGYHFEVGKVG